MRLTRIYTRGGDKGETSLGDGRAGYTRDDVADQMTPAQIAEAERLAAEWKPGDCGAEGRMAKSTK